MLVVSESGICNLQLNNSGLYNSSIQGMFNPNYILTKAIINWY